VKTPKPDRSQRQRIALVYTSSTGVEVLIEASWPRTLDWVGVREVIYAQQAWSDLTKPQRAALLAVADGQPARRDVAARLDDNGLTEDGAITNLGRWLLRVCADRYLDATFELDSPAGAVVVGPVAS